MMLLLFAAAPAGATTGGAHGYGTIPFGEPSAAETGAGPSTIEPTGIASGESIGTFAIGGPGQAFVPTGIASGESIGSHTLTTGEVLVAPTGIASGESIGTFAVSTGPVYVLPSSLTSGFLHDSSYNQGYGKSTSITRPTYEEGDVFVVMITGKKVVGAHASWTDATANKPSGWTLLGQTQGGSQNNLFYAKTAEAGEAASYAWTWTSFPSRDWRVHLSVLRGGDLSFTEYDGHTTNLTVSDTWTCPDITVDANSFVFRVATLGSTADEIIDIDPEEGVLLKDTSSYGGHIIYRMFKQGSAGATGEVTITYTDNVVTGVTGISFAVGASSGVGTPSVDLQLQVIDPTGIASGESIGSHAVGLHVAPTGIASGESIGSHAVTTGAVAVSPTGIASGESIGSHVVGLFVEPTGIASGESVGSHTLSIGAATIAPTGIASGEAIGSAVVDGQLNEVLPTGIASGESIGSHTVSAGAAIIDPTGITSGESLGSHTITTGAATVAPTGIASGESIGTHVIGLQIVPTGIASGESIGTHAVGYKIAPTGIASGESFGSHSISVGATSFDPTGITSSESVGSHVVTPGVVVLTPDGVATGEAVGSHTVVPGAVTVTPDGVLTGESIGSHTVTPGPVFILPTGIVSGEVFGDVSALVIFHSRWLGCVVQVVGVVEPIQTIGVVEPIQVVGVVEPIQTSDVCEELLDEL